jgi:hypothetical protein
MLSSVFSHIVPFWPASAYGARRSVLLTAILLVLMVLCSTGEPVLAETSHKVYFRGTDSELSVYFIRGDAPGPTLLLLGGIQGDEPGGYLAADLYADLTLKRGNLIVVPRANFLSIVNNSRGVEGDMNRKFAEPQKRSDRDLAIVRIIKDLMNQSDFFLNLHDGSGFYSPKWESPSCNPSRFGQSIIIDAETHESPKGSVIQMGEMVRRVLARVNPQISDALHLFRLNNHRTLQPDTQHKEQRLSATFHAVTRVGIPAFGIETSKDIKDYRFRVRYQTMVINAFLEEFGIVPHTPRMYLDNPQLKYLIVSINCQTPIVLSSPDVLKVQKGDTVRIVHIESNYSRGLTARIKGLGGPFNDLDKEVQVTQNSLIQVRKDRFLIAEIPVEIVTEGSPRASGLRFEPNVRHFCIRVNSKTFLVQPGEALRVTRGDTVVILDPIANLPSEEDVRAVRIDLRGFQASASPYPLEDRGHHINTAELQEKYGKRSGDSVLYALQAKFRNKVFAECFLAVVEPKLEYLVLREPRGGTFVVYSGEELQIPGDAMFKIMDVRTTVPEAETLSLTMSGTTVRWQQSGSAGIDASKLATTEKVPLDVTVAGRSVGRVWIRKGKDLRIAGSGDGPRLPLYPVRY